MSQIEIGMNSESTTGTSPHERLQLVIVLFRILPRVNRNPTWCLLLLGLLLILDNFNVDNLSGAGGQLCPGPGVLCNHLEVILAQLKVSQLLRFVHSSLDGSLQLGITNAGREISNLLGLGNWLLQEQQLIMHLKVLADILVEREFSFPTEDGGSSHGVSIGIPGGNCRSSLSLGLQGLEGSTIIALPVKGFNKRPARSLHHDKWFEDIKHPCLAFWQARVKSVMTCRHSPVFIGVQVY
jgi:hypothetical protein